MKERKYVKLRTDMYDDTKFKIIDIKPERDLIHYVWTRILTLGGKVNLEGDLYMSKTLPYTIGTLAIEFNRGVDQIKLALDVFIELEMLELTDGNVYRVKNFAKHQNIKVKEKIKSKDKDDEVKSKEVVLKEASKNEIDDNKNTEAENKIIQSEAEVVKIHDRGNLEIASSINKVDNMSNKNTRNNSQDNMLMIVESKKNNKVNKNKKKGKNSDINDEENIEDNKIVCFYDSDEEKPLEEGESVVSAWDFS